MEGYFAYKKIPNKLRKCRIAAGLKRDMVAEILGMKDTTILSRWETGNVLPTLVNAFKLAGLYKVYVEELFFDLMHTTRSEITAKALEVFNRRGLTSQKLSTPPEKSLTI